MSNSAPRYTLRKPTKAELIAVVKEQADAIRAGEETKGGYIGDVDVLWDLHCLELVLQVVKAARLPS